MNVRSLTDDECRTFREQGVAHLPGFADSEAVERLLEAALRRAETPSEASYEMSKSGRFLSDQNLYEREDAFRAFAFDTSIGEQAGKALGVDRVRLYFDQIFVCAPMTKTDHYWHQDITYWPVDGDEICSIWLSLTDCTPGSSALKFVKGTDRGPLLSQSAFGDGDDVTKAVADDSERAEAPPYHLLTDEFEILEWNYAAGDAALFNSRIMHSSGGNASPTVNRVAYSTRWIGDNMRLKFRPGWTDPYLLPHDDEGLEDGDLLLSRKFEVAWPAG